MDMLDDRNFQREIDTVRALHQTVVSLRAALERSRLEIEQLKERVWTSESCEIALQSLSVENHILRQKIINVNDFKENTTQTSLPYITVENFDTESSKYNSEETTKQDNTVGDIKLNLEGLNNSSNENSLTVTYSPTIFDSVRENSRKETPSPAKLSPTKLVSNKREESPRESVKTLSPQATPKQPEEKKSKKSPRKTTSIDKEVIKSSTEKVNQETSQRKTEKQLKFVNSQALKKHNSHENTNSNGKKHKLHNSKPTKLNDCNKTSKKSNRNKLSPRKTIVTVNVTLKSPKRNKAEKSDTENSSDSKDQTKSPSKNSENGNINNSQTLTESNSFQNMDDQTNTQLERNTENGKITEHKESDTDADEVDDIELIFTTGETTAVIKEELVSIADGNEGETECATPVLLNYRAVDFDSPDQNLSTENMDDDVFNENETTDNFENENTENFNFQNNAALHNSKSDNSINKDSTHTENESQRDKSLKSCYSYQDSSFESRSLDKDESFDKFDDKEKYLHKMWSNNSVLVETDISKCGIVDPEQPLSSNRRNTCPSPVPYRPIMHREALAKHNTRTLAVKFSSRNESTPRPILNEKQSPKTESEAQTDISALPSLWKSESYLAHKVAHQFTTLPSKFPMPVSQKSLRLSEKTKEARRVLLSDINFTSMVPELSRSADHLYQEGLEVMQTCRYGQYLNPPGPQLRRYNTGDSLTSPGFAHSQKFNWSPSDYSNFSSTKFDNSNMYLNRYRGSLTSINMQNSFDMPDNVKRRSYSSSHWKQNAPASFDNTRYVQTGQGPYRSVPNSPTRSRSVPFMSNYASNGQHYSGGVRHMQPRFKQGYSGIRYVNTSLPELHGDHDSGDSTDSLVEEAEQYLRSSIDCIVSGRDVSSFPRSVKRRASAPCPGRDSSPPRSWQPFLPHGIKDLRSDNWVKVIGPDSKIRGGRVRYVGYVLGQQEPFVGIELNTYTGNTDGIFNNRRYFECSPNQGLFIPFKKVVMGWRN